MNVVNLERIRMRLYEVNNKNFNMKFFNSWLESPVMMTWMTDINLMMEKDSECGTTGCVIGHSICLDEDLAKSIDVRLKTIDIEKNRNDYSINKVYTMWSYEFTGLKPNSEEWHWCFSATWWKRLDKHSEVTGAIDRIGQLIDGTWKQQEIYQKWFKGVIGFILEIETELEHL